MYCCAATDTTAAVAAAAITVVAPNITTLLLLRYHSCHFDVLTTSKGYRQKSCGECGLTRRPLLSGSGNQFKITLGGKRKS